MIGEEFKDHEPKTVKIHAQSCLKSCRKRSFSVTDGENSRKTNRVVFYSPANDVVEIQRIDERLMKSFMEKEKYIVQGKKYHKRTVSESTNEKKNTSLKIEVENFKINPLYRTKMPNFNAIHQEQFKKMESITHHQSRVKERSTKLLTPKNTKIEDSFLKKSNY
jgi:hypothetical protein